jgi:holin-like protein
MVVALLTLLLFQLLGEVLVRALHAPVPGPVAGMAALFAVLVVRGRIPDALRATSDALLQRLMLLLVPATAGLMLQLDRLGRDGIAIAVAGIAGTAVTLVTTALTLRALARTRR